MITCKDCIAYDDTNAKDGLAYCKHADMKVFADCEICNMFIGKNGKRPRFCRFAHDIEEMAGAMVISVGNAWSFSNGSECYATYEEAVSEAKKWLMEYEK